MKSGAARSASPPAAVQQKINVCIGQIGLAVGTLTHARQGQRERASFVYDETWLARLDRFEVSPDLPLIAGHQLRRAPSMIDSKFHLALADTAPDAWGRRIIARAHAKRRRDQPELAALTELDYLLAVDDFSRVGALRLTDAAGVFLGPSHGTRTTPPLLALGRAYSASHAVETQTETSEDLRFLQGMGTSLGGMRPKCSIIDRNGRLAIAKFPSVADTRSITRGEVLAMMLAHNAGIDTPATRIEHIEGTPVAIIERFDRTIELARIPYLSAASMLQASRQNDHSYTEIADAIRARGVEPTRDLQQLWRRMLFNLLITNVDDHLQNLGFLHSGHGLWRLAPAFDLNPFPDKDRSSKTWLSPDAGPIESLQMLLDQAAYFGLDAKAARAVAQQVALAVSAWRDVATSERVGIERKALADFAAAFEHHELQAARAL